METGILKSPTPFWRPHFAVALRHASSCHPSPPSHQSPRPCLSPLTILCLATLGLLHREPNWCLSSQTSHWAIMLMLQRSWLRKNNRNKRKHSMLLLLEQHLKDPPVLLYLLHHHFLGCLCHFLRMVKETTMSVLLHQHSRSFKQDLPVLLR